jgi:hypothetical protein
MIFVDEIKVYEISKILRWGKKWSHMWTDGNVEELHKFAEKIGLKRIYFQDKPRFPHYDIIPSKRQKALRNGAKYLPLKDWFNYDRYKRS